MAYNKITRLDIHWTPYSSSYGPSPDDCDNILSKLGSNWTKKELVSGTVNIGGTSYTYATIPSFVNETMNTGFALIAASSSSSNSYVIIPVMPDTLKPLVSNQSSYTYAVASTAYNGKTTTISFVVGTECVLFVSESNGSYNFAVYENGATWTAQVSFSSSRYAANCSFVNNTTSQLGSLASTLTSVYSYGYGSPISLIRNYAFNYTFKTGYYVAVAKVTSPCNHFFSDENGNVYFMTQCNGQLQVNDSPSGYMLPVVIKVGTL